MKSEWLSICVAASVLLSAAATAQEASTLDVNTTVQKEVVVTDADGNDATQLVDADTVVPGERVIYTTSFRNTGAEAAENVVITNPIADSLEYVRGSAFGPGMTLTFSVDGGATFADAASLEVVEDGESRPATPDDYTHVRWSMTNDLSPGAQGVVRFAAILK